MDNLRFVMFDHFALAPEQQTLGAAAFDLHASEGVEIYPSSPTWVSTGVGVEIPEGYCGQVWPRSGRDGRGFHTGAGLIDSDYRGEVKVLFHNMTDQTLVIKPGERIAQLLIVKTADHFQVEYATEFRRADTLRGANGFGSTGG